MDNDTKVTMFIAICVAVVTLWSGYLLYKAAAQHGQDSLQRVTICTQTHLTGLDLELCLDGTVQR